jgi:limonene-1,2-epoxide hydrolase
MADHQRPADVVAAFIAAIERKDIDAAVEMLADDVSYENVPISPISGRDAVRTVLAGFLAPVDAVDWRIVREVTAGTVVANERVDRFQIGDGWLELPVAGFFEVDEDGRIRLWRDYFDMATYTRQLESLTTPS